MTRPPAPTQIRPDSDRSPEDRAAARVLNHADLPQHLDRLYRAALMMTRSREDAEDLVQETYARVMRRPRLLRNDDDLGYLMRTMRNTWLSICRSRGAEARAMTQSAELLERRTPPDPLLPLETRALLDAVADLSPAYRDVIIAVDVVGLSYREAARALRTREGTVMSRLFRARTQVGRAMGRERRPSE